MTIKSKDFPRAGKFNYDGFPAGYYHHICKQGGVRGAWHAQKFARAISCLPQKKGQKILDIGCFSGALLSMLDSATFSTQIGVDILEKQIDFANKNFAQPHRLFKFIKEISEIDSLPDDFDCITLIEVIEHLDQDQIFTLMKKIEKQLSPGGTLLISTPNYLSMWPFLEILINKLSDVSYEEQHITRFTYFDIEKRLGQIYPDLLRRFRIEFKTTSHFIAPFLASISDSFAKRVSWFLDPQKWHLPFGNLIFIKLLKN